jgi:hypothetical protein
MGHKTRRLVAATSAPFASGNEIPQMLSQVLSRGDFPLALDVKNAHQPFDLFGERVVI